MLTLPLPLATAIEPIHVSIVMHNEEPASGLYPDFVNEPDMFWAHRDALAPFVDMLHANGVMFNFQSDWNFLQAVGLYDTGTPSTNGKNIVRYIKEDLSFEVDPHAHESQYNYADVAYLIEALGVPTSQIAGGFLAAPPEDSKLEYLWTPITATLDAGYTWQAQILWGGATSGHIEEDGLWVSGIWKPRDDYHFLQHDESAPLPHIGGYGREWPMLGFLLEKQQNGDLEEGKIHTATIFVAQNQLLAPDFTQAFEGQMQTYDAAGDIRWVGLGEVIDIWQTEYDSVPNILPFLPCADGNLLENCGFEQGAAGQPQGWSTFALPGGTGTPVFTWDDTQSENGSYSVKIENTGTRGGIWLQLLEVLPNTVYTLTGQVAFDAIVPPGSCGLRVVFRNGGGDILSFLDLPGHDGTRPFELDFPYNLKFRSPPDAATAELNCLLMGPGAAWFDDVFFAPAPTGDIAGQVTSDGVPVEGACVYLWGDPWGSVYEDYTDGLGRYLIEDVPVAFPRYVILAEKAGYRTRPAGEVAVAAEDVITADFELIPGADPVDDLRVKYGFLEQVDFAVPLEVPNDAVIPADPTDYPAAVQPYLQSDSYITADDPAILALADQILSGLDPADHHDTREVAWAVYEWIVKHINHDAVFTVDTRDVTSGIYQTILPGGWCWGTNFYDWGYRPAEALDVKCVICVEHSWLASALLRALNIPARARVGSAQFWVEKPGEYGYWVALATNGGSNTYREHGILGDGFGGGLFPSFYSVTSEPFLHEDWDMQSKCLWHETHPWGESYPATPEGLAQAHADMDVFETTGEAPPGPGVAPEEDKYQINYSDITVNLYNIGSQRVIDTRFPIVSESATHHDMDRQIWWTNHPECVTGTWIEQITNPPVEGTQRWFHVVFDVTDLLSLGDFDGNGSVDLDDYDAFATCFTGPDGGPISGACYAGDFDGDEDIDCDDWGQFVGAWTETGDPPGLPQCAGAPVPAVCAWGVVIMALLFLGAGRLVFMRTRCVGPADHTAGS
jgi:transglutaminase-like putative cysteine protease